MTQILPTQRTLHFAEAIIYSDRYCPPVMLEYRNTIYPLRADWRDTVHVFEHRNRLYALTVNLKTSTLKLDVFAGQKREPIGCLTLTDAEEIEAILGSKWQKLSVKSLAVLLANKLARKGGAA